MNASNLNLSPLKSIYPEHLWIEVDFGGVSSLKQPELNQICFQQVGDYLQREMGISVAEIVPSRSDINNFMWKLVNGFVLGIEGTRIVFIPSEYIDIQGFEVPQEWVDLPHWAADYYVPVQVDRELNCLRLWGFITHQALKHQSNFDPLSRNYEVGGNAVINELDALWISCEFQTDRVSTSQQLEIKLIAQLSDSAAINIIDQLKTHKSVFSPRLKLSFERWGAILDDPDRLQMYKDFHSPELMTIVSDFFTETLDSIDRGWRSIEGYLKSLEPIPGYMSSPSSLLPISGVDIHHRINDLYREQAGDSQVALPENIDSPELLLTYLIQHTHDRELRWKAAEYLWKIEPNSKIYCRRIKDLDLVVAGEKMGLMIAAIPLSDGRYALLYLLHLIGSETHLPANVCLKLLSETGDRLYQANSNDHGRDNYLQIHFTADRGTQFNLHVILNDIIVEESFIV